MSHRSILGIQKVNALRVNIYTDSLLKRTSILVNCLILWGNKGRKKKYLSLPNLLIHDLQIS